MTTLKYFNTFFTTIFRKCLVFQFLYNLLFSATVINVVQFMLGYFRYAFGSFFRFKREQVALVRTSGSRWW